MKHFTAVLLLTASLAGCQNPSPTPTPTAAITPEPLRAVSAMARLEPAGEVHIVAAPAGRSSEPVKTWLVQEGETVRQGQVIASMDSESLWIAEMRRAESGVAKALAEKARIEAGPQEGEVRRQRAEIERLQRERRLGMEGQELSIIRAQTSESTARREWERYRSLLKDGAVSQSVYDQKELEYELRKRERDELEQAKTKLDETLTSSVESARGELDRIQEVRPTDIQVAASEVAAARAEVERVRADLEKCKVRAPIAGKILEILTRAGELPKDGLAEIGAVDQMVAIAEVHQQDAGRVKVGQVAELRSPALGKPVKGRVKKLGAQVLRQRIFSNIPGENFDQRVVEVEIVLDMLAAPEVARLSNLQAEAVIEVASP